MTDLLPNYAELQARIDKSLLTLDECYRMGSTYKAYGWSCTPYGHWPQSMKDAFGRGYRGETKP